MRMRTWNGRRVRELMKATLILANGSVFSGTSIGGTSDRICEMVFNTSMAGYQEILTDPSYAGQGNISVGIEGKGLAGKNLRDVG